jgi:hypothetical protein
MKVELMKKFILSVGFSFAILYNFGQPGCDKLKVDFRISDTCKVLFSDSGESNVSIITHHESGLELLYRKETTYYLYYYYLIKSEKSTKYLIGTNAEGNSSYTLTIYDMPNYDKPQIITKDADYLKLEGDFSMPYFISKHLGCCEYTDYYELSSFPENEKFLSYNKSRFEIHASGYDRSRSKENYVIYLGYDMCPYYQDATKTVLGTLNYSINQKINGSVVFKKKNPEDKVGFPGFAPSKIQLMENGEPVGEPTSYYRENPIAIHSENLNYLQDASEINNLGIIVTFLFYGEGKDRQSFEKDYKIEFVNGKVLQEEIIVE